MEPKNGTGLEFIGKSPGREILTEFQDLPDELKITLLKSDFSERPYPIKGNRVKVYLSPEGDITGLKFID